VRRSSRRHPSDNCHLQHLSSTASTSTSSLSTLRTVLTLPVIERHPLPPLTMLPLLLILLTLIPSTRAQTTPPECLRLSGSSACPGFSSSYISPSNLSTAFPFFSTVTDVPSFDAGVFRYLSDPDQFRRTKFVNQLGCAASDVAGNGTTEGQEGVGIRWERTVLCSQWVNLQYSLGCLERYSESFFRHSYSLFFFCLPLFRH
jgi:hypothetical protein